MCPANSVTIFAMDERKASTTLLLWGPSTGNKAKPFGLQLVLKPTGLQRRRAEAARCPERRCTPAAEALATAWKDLTLLPPPNSSQ